MPIINIKKIEIMVTNIVNFIFLEILNIKYASVANKTKLFIAVLENLITQKLILQEAKKRNIEVTGDEINLEIIKIEENLSTQETTLDQALQLQGMTRDQLVNEIKIQQAIQKMVSEDIEITDKEINEFITQNKDQFPEGTTDEAMKTQAREALLSQILQEKTQTFLEELRAKAIIKTYTSY